jgi:hypothetical protein
LEHLSEKELGWIWFDDDDDQKVINLKKQNTTTSFISHLFLL